jgi:hypothetical protein
MNKMELSSIGKMIVNFKRLKRLKILVIIEVNKLLEFNFGLML